MMKNCRSPSLWALATLACVVLSLPIGADEARAPLPDPDDRPADMSKPVQVYILMGQSNMLGFGKINGANGSLTHAVKEKKLGKDALAVQKKLLEAFKQEIHWPVEQAIAEIEGLKKSGDVYRLSLVFRDHDKAFKGIDKFDMAVGAAGKELRGSRMRSAISTGKKFYAFIDEVKRLESKRKGPRSAAGIKSITAYLNRFAKREKDSIYGRAAAIAAKKIADPGHVVDSVSSYIRLAQTAE